jgi:hypothetical protein
MLAMIKTKTEKRKFIEVSNNDRTPTHAWNLVENQHFCHTVQ